MKSVAYDGVAAVTTDEVADALLELALTVARFNSYELVTIPVAGAEGPEELTLMLGPTIHLSAMTVAEPGRSGLAGAEAAVTRLRTRTESFSYPLLDPEADVDAFLAG